MAHSLGAAPHNVSFAADFIDANEFITIQHGPVNCKGILVVCALMLVRGGITIQLRERVKLSRTMDAMATATILSLETIANGSAVLVGARMVGNRS